MVAWYWLIFSALGGMVFTKFCDEFFDWDNILTDFISFCTLVVIFIPCTIWNVFFKMTIKPVPKEKIEKAGLVPFKRWGNLCLFIDKKASDVWAKIFFVRIKKNPIDK